MRSIVATEREGETVLTRWDERTSCAVRNEYGEARAVAGSDDSGSPDGTKGGTGQEAADVASLAGSVHNSKIDTSGRESWLEG